MSTMHRAYGARPREKKVAKIDVNLQPKGELSTRRTTSDSTHVPSLSRPPSPSCPLNVRPWLCNSNDTEASGRAWAVIEGGL